MQGAADPDTVVVSAATQRLVAGLFVVEDRGAQPLKGIEQPVQLYRVVGAGVARRRTHAHGLLHAVSPLPEDELQAALAKLADAELLYARGLPPEATYQFKHALMQDAAYAALLKSTRRDLHRRVAQTLTERFPALAEAQPHTLARHWSDAGEAEPAVAAWTKAAQAARARHAYKEAEEGYRQALAMLGMLPESPERDAHELERVSALRGVLGATRGLTAPGRRDEARTLLAEIYGWFTEGFDTKDLQDAKALLEELGT